MTGCATTETPRLQVVAPPKVERVEVVVTKPCINAADLPTPPPPTKVDPSKADTRQLAAAIAADVKQQDIYIEKAAAILASCSR